MTEAQTQNIAELLPLLTRGVIDAISDRPREPELQRQARAQSAMRLIESFKPEDGVEIMRAGQAVLMGAVAEDCVHDANRATMPDIAERHRRQGLAMARMQLSLLKELRLHRGLRNPAKVKLPGQAMAAPRPAAEIPVSAVVPTVPPASPTVTAAPQSRPNPVPGPHSAPPRVEASRPATPPAPVRMSPQIPPQAATVPARPVHVVERT